MFSYTINVGAVVKSVESNILLVLFGNTFIGKFLAFGTVDGKELFRVEN